MRLVSLHSMVATLAALLLPAGGRSDARVTFVIEETGGCSCEQIIVALGLGRGQEQFGCSTGVMRTWVELVNP